MHSLVAAVALVTAPLAGQGSAFPTRPLSAGPTALGDGGRSPTGLDAVFLNAARVVGNPGVAATYLIQEETGLRGSALTMGFAAGLPLAVSVWKYDVRDLFDDALLAADPALATLGVYVTGLDVAVGMPVGAWAVGLGLSGEFHRTLGRDDQRFASRVGASYETGAVTAGVSWTNGMESDPVAGVGSGTARGMVGWRAPSGPVVVELGFDAGWQVAERRLDPSTSVLAGPEPLQFLAGFRWRDRQFAGGVIMRFAGASLTIAHELAGRDALGGLTVFTFALGW